MRKSIFLAAALVCGMAAANAQNYENGHEYVDLGLPSGLKWATMNVGATAPEAYGDYYAWGETETKETYSWATYKHGSAAEQLTKYCTDASYGLDGFKDGKTSLDPEDDAASVNWGGSWRMPTDDEWQELIDNCEWTWTARNGKNGYEVKSKANGNSIFLPAAGFRSDGKLVKAGDRGSYWSGSLRTSIPYNALGASLGSGGTNESAGLRCCGFSVRPVAAIYTVTVNAAENGTVEADRATAQMGDEVTLTIAPSEGYELDQLVVKQGETEVTVSADHKFTMPAGDVIVSATFKAKTPASIGNAEAFEFYAENGRVVCGGDFRIYDLLGRDVTRLNGHLNGVYVVKCGETARKMAVR